MQQMLNEPTAGGVLSSPSSCTRLKTTTHLARDHEMMVDTNHSQSGLRDTSSNMGVGVSNNRPKNLN